MIFICATLFFLIVTLAKKHEKICVLQVSCVDKETEKGHYVRPQFLSQGSSGLLVAGEYSEFKYSDSGTFQKLMPDAESEPLFLSIDESGKLVLSPEYSSKFGLKKSPRSSQKPVLSYDDTSTFELCGDASIGLQSGCENAIGVNIDYLVLGLGE